MPDDITPDAGTDVPADATPFDLDSALEEAASSAPDEWRGKVSKIQSEVKNLRGRSKTYTDRFEGLADVHRDAVLGFVDLLKGGDADQVARWLIGSGHAVAGDRFGDLVSELTPAQQAAVEEAVAEEAAQAEAATGEALTPETIQQMVQDAIKADRETQTQERRQQEQLAEIDKTLRELELDPGSFEARQVMILARDEHGGDLRKAHEAYETWVADQAKAYLQKHGGDASLLSGNAQPASEPSSDTASLTVEQRIARRIAEAKKAGT